MSKILSRGGGGVAWSQGVSGLGGAWSRGGGSRRVPHWGGVPGPGGRGGDPPGTATAAGSTHPAGMHSC